MARRKDHLKRTVRMHSKSVIELVKIVRTPDFLESLKAEGAEPVASTPEYFADHIRKETARWAKVIREANITAN